MAIDLLNLEPTTITRDLSNKYILLAAPMKYGKTTFCTNIPGALILSMEPGLNAHAGVYAQKVLSWSDMKLILRELKKPEVMAKFKTICFDTIEILAQLCQDFICQRAGVQTLAEVPYGKLYKEYEIEFSRTIRAVANLGYGCVFVCHTEVKELPTEQENITIERLQPKLDKRAFDIINGLVDIIGVGVMEFDENGNQRRVLYTQETPTVRAGNRFTYFPPKIDFSYKAVLDHLSEAIEAEGRNNNATIVDKQEIVMEEKKSFDELFEEARELWKTLVGRDQSNEDKILKKVEIIFGRKMKLSEVVYGQEDLLELVILDMKDML